MTSPRTVVRPCGPISPTAVLLLIGLVFPAQTRLWPGVSELPAQGPTMRIDTQPLMKRIAEALDGHRTGGAAYVVAKRAYPHDVYGVYDTPEEAGKAAKLVATRPDIFGPFLTIRDGVGPIGCVHRGPTDITRLRAVGEPLSAAPSRYCPLRAGLAHDQVDSIIVTVHVRGGRPIVLPLPADADALFLSASALDKFAIPYYSRLYGPDSAGAMRREMLGIR
jgi:hypothetical protein